MNNQEVKEIFANFWRARRLLDLAVKLKNEHTQDSKRTSQDLLGASVVFLHATLEELLRTVARARWVELSNDD
ncbi:hypothetical protein Cylst_0200 [Cylindrospermum stagnale PCC 7417]|uniref:Uncharacterized protein n=1 Tax=Cylindrospermum stagnale PCC 7417 TaxID=56107 RepID=K9WQE5_9NOST|nr:hypothetical protein [Cylindrospermum stagnale]AFZ22575.1 hypothetical protein Cylst_0200 [Cylindrospermum stagnale PCC 7417]